MIETLNALIVGAAQMGAIEERLFALGMPVAALMEKAALALSAGIQKQYPLAQFPRVGVIAGPGHNGGDALVAARELWLSGYQVTVYAPLPRLKPLTQSHAQYAQALGIPWRTELEEGENQDFWLEGLLGLGQTRPLGANLSRWVRILNDSPAPTLSIDVPAGLHSDTGEVLGAAVVAERSFCLGLWKRVYFQDAALAYLGRPSLLDIGIPPTVAAEILANAPRIQCFTRRHLQKGLPLNRPPVTHKYQQGRALLVCGSRRYPGSAVLAALGARASGAGMLSIAAPASLQSLLIQQCPEAIVLPCEETPEGAVAALPPLDFSQFQTLALGPGLTLAAAPLVRELLAAPVPLILDADALNVIAAESLLPTLTRRSAPTLLTPHLGEFRRLFPDLNPQDRMTAAQEAARQSQSVILFKGARTVIAAPEGETWLIADSTPALARGGSGDVLTGLLAGLGAQGVSPWQDLGALAALWHAETALGLTERRTVLGVDPVTLAQSLIPALGERFL
jgi:NAD(P)H-hydrate epimerase